MTVRATRHLEVKLGDGIKAISAAWQPDCAANSCEQFTTTFSEIEVYTTLELVLKRRSYGQTAKDVAFLPAAPESRLVQTPSVRP